MVTFAFVANSYEYKCPLARIKRTDSKMHGYLGGNGSGIRATCATRFLSESIHQVYQNPTVHNKDIRTKNMYYN